MTEGEKIGKALQKRYETNSKAGTILKLGTDVVFDWSKSHIPHQFVERVMTELGQGKKILVLDGMLNGEHVNKHIKDFCKDVGVSLTTYYASMHDPAFVKLLSDIRKDLYPVKKAELAERILADAMTPLSEAVNVVMTKRGPEQVPYHASLVRTREQAGAIIGLLLKQPEMKHVSGSVDILHSFMKADEKHLEHFVTTGEWHPEAGDPPWLQKP